MRLHRTVISLALLAASCAFAGETAERPGDRATAPFAGLSAGQSAETSAGKPSDKPSDRPAACASAMDGGQLQGEWTGSIEGTAQAARLQLGPHPQWKGSVKGTIERGAARRAMVGDIVDGNLTLEESADGRRISATWLGDVVDGSCGREIRGDFIEGDDAAPRPFVLRKIGP